MYKFEMKIRAVVYILIICLSIVPSYCIEEAQAQQLPPTTSNDTQALDGGQSASSTTPTPISDQQTQSQQQDTTDSGTKTSDGKPKVYGGLLLPQARKSTNFSSSNLITIESNIAKLKARVYVEKHARKDPISLLPKTSLTSLNGLLKHPILKQSACSGLVQVYTSVIKAYSLFIEADQNNDDGYITLIPEDSQRNPISQNGWFNCGEAKGVEKAYIRFPDDIDCDTCTLEWIWKTNDFKMRQCADISVLSEQTEMCHDMCQNGGICNKGSCVCREGYIGDYCETTANSPMARILSHVPRIAFYVILAIIFIMGAIGLIFWFVKKEKRSHLPNQVNINARKADDRYQEFDKEQPGNNKKPGIQLSVKV